MQLDKAKKGRAVFRNFKDPCLRNSQAILDLIDAIQPGSIGYDMVDTGDTASVIVTKGRKKKERKKVTI